jgi:phage terminase large subunit-like protein
MKTTIKELDYDTEKQLLQTHERYFAQKVFGYIVAEHHNKMLNHIHNTHQTLILAPRGSGKTKISDISHIAFKILNNPNERLLLLSDTHNHGTRFLGSVKAVLETSPTIKKFYGNVIGSKWTDMEITTSLRTDESITEATVTATGIYGSYVTSGHFTEIVCDDLITFENSASLLQRTRMEDRFKTTLLPTLLNNAPIRVIGTRYHFNDLYGFLIKTLKYEPLILPAIIDMGMPNERSIWPDFMPLHTKVVNGIRIKGLYEIKEDIGSLIFGLQYQNDTKLQESGTIFRWEWFNFYTETPPNLKIYQAADLAISKKDTADFFVLLTLGIDNAGNIYILDIFRQRGITFNAQLEIISKKAAEWKPLKIAIEDNGYQAALVQEAQRLSLLPIVPLRTTKDKVMRAQMRSGLVESGRVFVKHGMHEFVSELILIRDTKGIDDQFDAFDFALTVAEMKGSEESIQESYYIPGFDAGNEFY